MYHQISAYAVTCEHMVGWTRCIMCIRQIMCLWCLKFCFPHIYCYSYPQLSKPIEDSTPPSHRGRQRANKAGEWCEHALPKQDKTKCYSTTKRAVCMDQVLLCWDIIVSKWIWNEKSGVILAYWSTVLGNVIFLLHVSVKLNILSDCIEGNKEAGRQRPTLRRKAERQKKTEEEEWASNEEEVVEQQKEQKRRHLQGDAGCPP